MMLEVLGYALLIAFAVAVILLTGVIIVFFAVMDAADREDGFR